jgi:HlyD family secretion protein
MNVWIKRSIATALVLGVSATGYAFVKGSAGKKKDQITYETAPAEVKDVRSFVSATGIIQPWKIIDIKSNVAGRLDRLYVDLGSPVRRGQKIADIDPTDTKASYDQASADLDAANARQQQAVANLTQQRSQLPSRIAASEKSVSAAQARLEEAKANRDVQPALTELNIDQANANLASAGKAIAQARQSKQQLEEQLSQLKEVTLPLNVQTVENNAAQARANMETTEAELRRQRQLLGLGYMAKSEVEATFARLATLRANVKTADQRMNTLKRENQLAINELTSRIEEAQSRIEESEAREKQTRSALALAEKNRVQNRIREHEVQAAAAAVAQAKAELNSARAERGQIEVRTQEITAANAQIVRSQASRKQAQTNLGYTSIIAPREGVVIAKNVEEGTVVPSSRGSIGSTNALLQIGDVSRLWIVCSVDETDIGQVSVGQKVTVKVDAYPSLLIDGKVIRIDPQAKIEQNVTMIPVTVEISEPDLRFKPGMNAECEFVVAESNNVLTVPNEALQETEGTYKVQKLVDGKPQDVEVEVGLAGQDATEVRSGLEPGELVVTKTIKPEEPEVNNPFGNPFGRRRDRGGAGGAGRGGAGGGAGRGGGGRGGR